MRSESAIVELPSSLVGIIGENKERRIIPRSASAGSPSSADLAASCRSPLRFLQSANQKKPHITNNVDRRHRSFVA